MHHHFGVNYYFAECWYKMRAMTEKTITPQQFAALVALTSIRAGGKTHKALHRHLVLGHNRNKAATMSGLKSPVLYRAIETLELAAARAREYVRLTPAETSADSAPASAPAAAP